MTRCKHTHARYQLRQPDGAVTDTVGCYSVVAEAGDNFGYGWTKGVLVAICHACEATLPLGPSNDEPAAVQQEMRAAEMLSTYHSAGLAHFVVYDFGNGCFSIYDQAEIQPTALAWAWDISRPIAEQLAETLRVDAEADEVAAAVAEILGDADLAACDSCEAPFGRNDGACVDGKGSERVVIPEHPPDPACTCDATAPDAATAIALGWTLRDGVWRCPFWATDVDEVVA